MVSSTPSIQSWAFIEGPAEPPLVTERPDWSKQQYEIHKNTISSYIIFPSLPTTHASIYSIILWPRDFWHRLAIISALRFIFPPSTCGKRQPFFRLLPFVFDVYKKSCFDRHFVLPSYQPSLPPPKTPLCFFLSPVVNWLTTRPTHKRALNALLYI